MNLSITEPLGISQAKVDELSKQYLPADVEVTYYNTPTADEAEKIARAKSADAVIIANSPFKDDVLTKCLNLRFISVAFTGVDHLGMDYCKAHNITVSNCSGYANVAVSELVMGLALSLYRKLRDCDDAVRTGGTRDGLLGLELHGKTFGVIGAGAIGLHTIKLAQAFGCNVVAYNRTPKSIPGVTFLSLDDVLKQSDIVSLHVPLTNATTHLINADKLALMKSSAILINTARGAVVDNQALANALEKGTIAGAGIDVFEMEPPIPSKHPLLHAPNPLLAPHIGFATAEAMEKRAVIAFENVAAWLKGQPQNVQ
ncbi:MAG: 2-hydroxyacid dehydrogenase [Veillonellaceae bacterium]|nr:2-hydroxyacid dehydrogenase [Veillonellaceae bacterium]